MTCPSAGRTLVASGGNNGPGPPGTTTGTSTRQAAGTSAVAKIGTGAGSSSGVGTRHGSGTSSGTMTGGGAGRNTGTKTTTGWGTIIGTGIGTGTTTRGTKGRKGSGTKARRW